MRPTVGRPSRGEQDAQVRQASRFGPDAELAERVQAIGAKRGSATLARRATAELVARRLTHCRLPAPYPVAVRAWSG